MKEFKHHACGWILMLPQLSVKPVKTNLFNLGEDLLDFILKNVSKETLQEKCVLAVTSKLVSLSEGRVVSKSEINKIDLLTKEADIYLGEIAHGCHLTIKHGLLVASAGIDESNSADASYILYPQDPFKSANVLCKELKQVLGIKDLGVLFTDSRTSPLRIGVTGVALAYAGFDPIGDFRGKSDLYGRALKMTRVNKADALAAAAVLLMGEAAEQCPLSIVAYPDLFFTDKEAHLHDVSVPIQDDMYQPLLMNFKQKT